MSSASLCQLHVQGLPINPAPPDLTEAMGCSPEKSAQPPAHRDPVHCPLCPQQAHVVRASTSPLLQRLQPSFFSPKR